MKATLKLVAVGLSPTQAAKHLGLSRSTVFYREMGLNSARQQVIDVLRRHEPEFRDAGVGAMFVFGSVARDQADEGSDVDVFFDLKRPRGFTLFDLVALQERMQDILGAKVDLMTRKGIHPRRRDRIEADAVQIF